MVKLRLTRGGTKKQPFYRIVVMDSRTQRDGRSIATVGTYHPVSRAAEQVTLDEPTILKWLKLGAKPSPTVDSLLRKSGVLAKHRTAAKPST